MTDEHPMSVDRSVLPGSPTGAEEALFASLRALAENARSESPTWWLWDEEGTPGRGPMLMFAQAASPENITLLLDEIDRLQAENDRLAAAYESVADALNAATTALGEA